MIKDYFAVGHGAKMPEPGFKPISDFKVTFKTAMYSLFVLHFKPLPCTNSYHPSAYGRKYEL